ncbi:hypothetical protein [uncultured Methanobrevibacter sp.]|uniref:hypothetical protein n=1 Tax=uncultured Methanobrevibacter sp. TaxID=253161 RepID=UPI0025D9F2B7|nr:hypothetical protein [uncultured Methanobrevibacter sp.]
MGKCKPKYKNLNLIQSFSDQRYVTVQLMEQACMNDEWLHQQVEKLKYLSSPAVRKWFKFSEGSLDIINSYGCKVSNDGDVIFDNDTEYELPTIDFTEDTMGYVDVEESLNNGVVFSSFVDGNGNNKKRAMLKHDTVGTPNYSTALRNPNGGVNSFWYVGFDKNKTYQVRPDWIKNWKDYEIPAVCRAQTVKIKEGCTGLLEAVALRVETTGTTKSNWGSPLYVQIWPTKVKQVERTTYDRKTKKTIKVKDNQGNVIKDNIRFPKGNPGNALATGVYNPSRTTPGFITIELDKPVQVKPGEYYAIVISSPLSHYDHCPRIGGWGRNCNIDKYADGDAFLSEDNGRHWKRYGKPGESQTEYKMGLHTPQDFSFELKITNYGEEYTRDDCYLYLKPIQCNPLKEVILNADDDGDATSATGKHIEYQISTDGRNWEAMQNKRKTFNNSHPTRVFIRAKMWQDSSNNKASPTIERITITLKTDVAMEMFAKTQMYTPKITPMLGASRWGRVYAPFICDPNVECSVDIVKDNPQVQHFTVVDNTTLYDAIESYKDEEEIASVLDFTILSDSTKVYDYLVDTPDAVTLLNNLGIYPKPYTDGEGIIHPFGWFEYNSGGELVGGLKLNNSPAYPILKSVVNPDNGEQFTIGEWYDYTVDYDKDTILFDLDVLDGLPNGNLEFTYNPVFVQDLLLEEVGDRVNLETGLPEQGLIIDYFKQEYEIGLNEIRTRTLPLRVIPVEPLREVILTRNEEDITLIEGRDFDVDYDNHQVIFKVTDIDGVSSILQNEDTISIVYIPNFEETGIYLVYRAKRTNSDKQVHIKDYYVEYKV